MSITINLCGTFRQDILPWYPHTVLSRRSPGTEQFVGVAYVPADLGTLLPILVEFESGLFGKQRFLLLWLDFLGVLCCW